MRVTEQREPEVITGFVPSFLDPTGGCPKCGKSGFAVLEWTPPVYLDPKMKKLRCEVCGEVSYLAPKTGRK